MTPELRDQLVAELRSEEDSIRVIAKRHGLSPSTLSRLAQAEGLRTAHRPQTEAAIAAASMDYAARRARLRLRLMDKAEGIVEQLDKPLTVWNFGGSRNTYAQKRLPRPDVASQRSIVATVGILIDKMHALDEAELAAGRGQHAGGLLDSIEVGLREARVLRLAKLPGQDDRAEERATRLPGEPDPDDQAATA